MYKTAWYMVDNVLKKEPPIDPEVKYTIYLEIAARDGYILQNIFSNERATRLTLPAGLETFWREVLLDEV